MSVDLTGSPSDPPPRFPALSRRKLLLGAGFAAVGASVPSGGRSATQRVSPDPRPNPEVAVLGGIRVHSDRFDPWIEIIPAAIEANLKAVSAMAGGRPLMAVAKNNAYGLGLREVGPLLDRAPEVAGLAVVRIEEAHTLSAAGVRKPILLMARTTLPDAVNLVRHDVRLALFGDDAARFAREAARQARRSVRAHLYLDTGMARMGRPVAGALEWARGLVAAGVEIEGVFTELTEDPEFDREQVGRLTEFRRHAERLGMATGRLHAASSAALAGQPETYLDVVRPGLALYGGFASRAARERGGLRPGFRLRARVTRVERLEAGDGVSYHRRWRAARPTWVATLPVGHVDGYPAEAVKGCEVLIGGAVYPVIGTVSASHTIIAIGDDRTVDVGDVATLIGPDHPAIEPDVVAQRAQVGEYTVFFRLSPLLPRAAGAA